MFKMEQPRTASFFVYPVKLMCFLNTFTDINECDSPSMHNCSHICENLIGSYKCSCYPGYQLKEDGFRCEGKL